MSRLRIHGSGTLHPVRLSASHLKELLHSFPANSPVRKIIEHLLKHGISLTENDIELIKKIDFPNIDLNDPANQYHLDMIRALFQKPENDGLPHRLGKNLYDVIDKMGLNLDQVRGIKVEIFKVEDISLDVGSRRDVDLVTLETDRDTITFTVSLDKAPFRHVGESHSRQEANVLMSQNTSQGRWATQRCFGFVTVEINGRPHGSVLKEFLPGVMLSNHIQIIGSPEEDMYARDLCIIAFNHGRMIGNIIGTTGGFPIDMTPENVIVNDNDGVTCRTCDLSSVETSGESWLKRLEIDIKMWKKYAWHYLFGITSELNQAKRDSFLALIRKRMGDGTIETLSAACQQLETAPGEAFNNLLLQILEQH